MCNDPSRNWQDMKLKNNSKTRSYLMVSFLEWTALIWVIWYELLVMLFRQFLKAGDLLILARRGLSVISQSSDQVSKGQLPIAAKIFSHRLTAWSVNFWPKNLLQFNLIKLKKNMTHFNFVHQILWSQNLHCCSERTYWSPIHALNHTILVPCDYVSDRLLSDRLHSERPQICQR